MKNQKELFGTLILLTLAMVSGVAAFEWSVHGDYTQIDNLNAEGSGDFAVCVESPTGSRYELYLDGQLIKSEGMAPYCLYGDWNDHVNTRQLFGEHTVTAKRLSTGETEDFFVNPTINDTPPPERNDSLPSIEEFCPRGSGNITAHGFDIYPIPFNVLPKAISLQFGTVVNCYDGDSINVNIMGVGIRDVRVLQVDTPELPDQEGAVAAKNFCNTLLAGKFVILEADEHKLQDGFGRELRYLYYTESNGQLRMYQETLLTTGHAVRLYHKRGCPSCTFPETHYRWLFDEAAK